MATLTTEATTHLDRLRQALDIVDRLAPPSTCSLTLDSHRASDGYRLPPEVCVHPLTAADEAWLLSRLSAEWWQRDHSHTTTVDGIEVRVYRPREGR